MTLPPTGALVILLSNLIVTSSLTPGTDTFANIVPALLPEPTFDSIISPKISSREISAFKTLTKLSLASLIFDTCPAPIISGSVVLFIFSRTLDFLLKCMYLFAVAFNVSPLLFVGKISFGFKSFKN